MAGDTSYLTVNDSFKNILDEKYIGKMRYNNLFSLNNFTQGNSDMYKLEYRLKDGQTSYCIVDNQMIESIELVLNTNSPITELEQEAFNDTNKVLQWINHQKDVFKNQDIHFVLQTNYD
jgi:hypothetical protein